LDGREGNNSQGGNTYSLVAELKEINVTTRIRGRPGQNIREGTGRARSPREGTKVSLGNIGQGFHIMRQGGLFSKEG